MQNLKVTKNKKEAQKLNISRFVPLKVHYLSKTCNFSRTKLTLKKEMLPTIAHTKSAYCFILNHTNGITFIILFSVEFLLLLKIINIMFSVQAFKGKSTICPDHLP